MIDAPPSTGLEALLAPRSVAVIGASHDPTHIGGRPVSYMLRAGFSGPIWPVNPNREMVQGLKAYPSITDVPEAPDACIIAVAARLVPDILEACGERGVRAAVILSSGFAEAGEDGKAAQARITETARKHGIRVLGPNTLGLFNAHTGWMGTFASTVLYGTPEPGPIGVASQSGAIGSELFALLRRRGLNTGIWITTGNEADVGLADAITYLSEDPDTHVIVAYAEGVRNGPAMRSALARASEAGRPVLFLKSGRSAVGAAAVTSHTAALAGSDRIYSALFEQMGALRVANAEELVDAAYAVTHCPLPEGRRLLILTISGGAGVQMADAAADLDLDVPSPPAEAQAALKALVPFAGVRNPVDTTAQVFNDIGLVGNYLRVLMADDDYDAITLFLTSVAASEEVARPLVAELEQARVHFPDVPLVVSLSAPPELTRPYTEAGFPVYEEPTRAVRAIALLCRLAEGLGRDRVTPTLDVGPPALQVPDHQVDEHRAMEVLESWGVPCVERRLARSEDEAAAAARELGAPVALKIVSAAIVHKTDVGGVLLGVAGEDAVREGYRTLMERAADRRPEARIQGVLVAAMADEGADAVVGVAMDPTFGPAVMVGLGGVLVEVLDDVAFRLAPFDADEGRRMIGELQGARLFEAFRGRPELDVDALAELLSKISIFAASEAERLSSVDLNPVRVLPRGQGVVALDAVIVPKEGS
ncbi:MAG: acetate--CoA ligase family protein [Gemmatimonadota bacterium]